MPLLAAAPRSEGGKRVLFFSGDDAPANADVGGLIERLGVFRIDIGPLGAADGSCDILAGPLPALNLPKFG